MTPSLEHFRAAELLEALTDGRASISYLADAYAPGDPTSEGHLFAARLAGPPAGNDFDADQLDEMSLDSRDSRPLPQQLASELRRVGRLYLTLADQVERRAGLNRVE